MNNEEKRLEASRQRKEHWKRWGPYLSERAWGTVREDYSSNGDAWQHMPHDHARSKAYRWNEDGIAGICDRHQKICFAIALWNGRDPIIKERMFGLTGSEGNHGEDVKECYHNSRRIGGSIRAISQTEVVPPIHGDLGCNQTPTESPVRKTRSLYEHATHRAEPQVGHR